MQRNQRKGILARCFSGELQLWKAFWLVYLPVALILTLTRKALAEHASRTGETTALYFGILLSLVFGVWIVISIWRCAPNVKWRAMFFMARAWAIVNAMAIVTSAMSLLGSKT